MTDRHVAVLGAGPAGMRAAIAARQCGLRVTLIDEGLEPGGQIYRAPSGGTGSGPDAGRGAALRQALRESGARVLSRHRAWGAAPGPRLDCLGPDGPVTLAADALVIATGTTERVMPVPGITLPGVIGLAAATILLKAHGVVPGGPTVVAGVGPLLYAVAAGIRKAGGRVAAVVDLLGPAEWAAGLAGLVSRPDLLARGLGWMGALRAAGVPIHHQATVTAIGGETCVAEVEIGRVGADWSLAGAARWTVAAGGVAIGHGLSPASEVARLLGVPHRHVADRGGWVPEISNDRLGADGIFLAGDCAGVAGAAAAEWSGRLAGLAAARDLGALSPAAFGRLAGDVRRRLRRAERFGAALGAMMALRPGLARAIAPETVVCRCEDVTRAAIDRAVAGGARHVNQVKSATRCGMGPCQGRSCAEAAAELVVANAVLAGAAVTRAAAGQWTARVPLRPVPLAAMLGDFTYADIPVPPLLPA